MGETESKKEEAKRNTLIFKTSYSPLENFRKFQILILRNLAFLKLGSLDLELNFQIIQLSSL